METFVMILLGLALLAGFSLGVWTAPTVRPFFVSAEAEIVRLNAALAAANAKLHPAATVTTTTVVQPKVVAPASPGPIAEDPAAGSPKAV